MARFVELHNNGRPVIVNTNSLQLVNKLEEGQVRLFFNDDEYDSWLDVDESYDEVKRLLMEMNKP